MPLEPGAQVPGIPVTALNWQDPPVNRWAFWHVREILPAYRVARGDGPARVLASAAAPVDLLGIETARVDGPPARSARSSRTPTPTLTR